MFGTSSTVENAPSVLSLWGQVPRATPGYALGCTLAAASPLKTLSAYLLEWHSTDLKGEDPALAVMRMTTGILFSLSC